MDWMFFAVMGGGIGALAAAARQRSITTRRRTARLGMSPRADLLAVPPELQQTVLWQLCEGGAANSVIGGRLSLGAHDLDVTCFDLDDLRRKRFEWAWLEVAAPFRLHTPLSVVACTVPRRLPHLLVKRAGPADRIEPREPEHAGSPHESATELVARAALAVSEWTRAAEAPPATLEHDPVDADLPAPWRAWADRSETSRLLLHAIAPELEPSARDHEFVVETLGPLVLVYNASGGLLSPGGLEDAVDAAVAICERLIATTPELDPRGVAG